MTRPKTRDERLNELVSIVMGVRWGMPGYDQRLVEMCSGFPAGSGGGGAKGSVGRPVEAQVIANVDEHRRDPASDAWSDFDKQLAHALNAAEELWDEYRRVAHPRKGVAMKSSVIDPGCELCAQVPDGCERCSRSGVPDHWCPTYATKKFEVPAPPNRKGQGPSVEHVRLCSSCYEGCRLAGRKLSHAEVLDHVEGRRRRFKVGA